jgi:hypothetical protein
VTGGDCQKFQWDVWREEKPDQYGVSLIGWPLEIEPQSLSNIKRVGQMSTLLDVVMNGACYLKKTVEGAHLPNPRSAHGKSTQPLPYVYKFINLRAIVDVTSSSVTSRTRAKTSRKATGSGDHAHKKRKLNDDEMEFAPTVG